ncbi:Protein of unknown function [Devosia sp. YR412]|uniref:DUF3298 domain-containing protein n=1 Tax=Devosia sp. YR412 TaxID=1881030 RepID=UPI0008B310EC|nr:DUF3298 domain-containing protein [Devosia sp. YR412]SEQ32700.1 Protein of unknown function [Devosia sp. YR412]
MLLRLAGPVVLLALGALPTSAASFDCAKAVTPFEQAICAVPDLSLADERLAKSFATSTGGLSKQGAALMRAGQRDWLDFAQRACTDDAELLASGSYDEAGGECLVSLFNTRSTALEQSRMLGGHRFITQGAYSAQPDPNEVDNPESYWKLATHELNYPLLDSDDPLAESFNGYIARRVEAFTGGAADAEAGGDDDSSADTSVDVTLKEVAGANRITLTATTYWYGHGAAHGNYTINYLHYYVPEEREVIADDIFSGDGWADTLVDAAWDQLQAQHKEWLIVEAPGDITEMVVDPTRWDLNDDYGLVIQFQPYDVAAYAYGAPTITIPWDRLDAIKAETQESVRFGF